VEGVDDDDDDDDDASGFIRNEGERTDVVAATSTLQWNSKEESWNCRR